MVDAYERSRRPRYKDADLVNNGIGAVEGAVFGEGRVSERKEKSWSYALVDGVFGDVDKEKRQHTARY